MSFKRLTRLLRSLPVVGMLMMSMAQCHAACSTVPQWKTVNVNMNGGIITVRPEDPPGTVLKTFITSIPAELSGVPLVPGTTPYYVSATCNGSGFAYNAVLKGQQVAGMNNVFSTNIPGIGVRLSRNVVRGSGDSYSQTYTTPGGQPIPVNGNSAAVYVGTTFHTEIVKTAYETGSGSLEAGQYTTAYNDGSGTGRPYIISTLGANIITIVTPTCSTDAGSIYQRVQLKRVSPADFNGFRSYAAETPFDIKLNCVRGTGRALNVMLAFQGTSAQYTAPSDGVLAQSIKTSDAAKNVGIQIVKRDVIKRPIFLGDEMAVGPTKDGQYVVPFIARYFQPTSRAVTPGKVAATMTFIIQYQ